MRRVERGPEQRETGGRSAHVRGGYAAGLIFMRIKPDTVLDVFLLQQY